MAGNRLRRDVLTYAEDLGYTRIECSVEPMGDDLLVKLSGGASHIGCAVLAVPRASLAGNGDVSATSSVLNVTGHRDEAPCRLLAETACKAAGRTVVCAGGIHVDDAGPGQISQILDAAERISHKMSADLR